MYTYPYILVHNHRLHTHTHTHTHTSRLQATMLQYAKDVLTPGVLARLHGEKLGAETDGEWMSAAAHFDIGD